MPNMKLEEIKEALLAAYDNYIDKDEFPLNTEYVFIEGSENYIAMGNRVYLDIGRVSEKNTLSLTVEPSEKNAKIRRISPIKTNDLKGLFIDSSSRRLKKINYKEMRKISEEMLEELFSHKQGIEGEIIKACCERVIKINEISRLESRDRSFGIFSFKNIDFIVMIDYSDKKRIHLDYILNGKYSNDNIFEEDFFNIEKIARFRDPSRNNLLY